MSRMELLTMEELLRHRQFDAPCHECVTFHYGMVEDIVKRYGSTFDNYGPTKGTITFRVSCEEALEFERECPVMGAKGYKIQLLLEGVTLFPFASVRSLG